MNEAERLELLQAARRDHTTALRRYASAYARHSATLDHDIRDYQSTLNALVSALDDATDVLSGALELYTEARTVLTGYADAPAEYEAALEAARSADPAERGELHDPYELALHARANTLDANYARYKDARTEHTDAISIALAVIADADSAYCHARQALDGAIDDAQEDHCSALTDYKLARDALVIALDNYKAVAKCKAPE